MIKPPFTDVVIKKSSSGFYENYCFPIAIGSKCIMVALVLWALLWPKSANNILNSFKWQLLENFNAFYIILFGVFAVFLIAIAVIPSTGKLVMGLPGEKPEYSNFSWFAMMFGAGLGVGLMVFATAEPLGLWASNPEILAQKVEANTIEALRPAYIFTFAHYGFHTWGVFVIAGLAMAYCSYTRGLPLTLRSALTPLIGRYANGFFGHIIDTFGVVATILAVSVTIGFGVSQFLNGVYAITGMEWIMNLGGETPTPSDAGLIAGLVIIMSLSILSAVSGVGKGVKYLSNLNLILSMVLLLTFVIFGSFFFAMTTYGIALVDYILNFLSLSFLAYFPLSEAEFTTALPAVAQPYSNDLFAGATNAWGSYDKFVSGLSSEAATLDEATLLAVYEAGNNGRQFTWQAGWTTFYWAWMVAYAPFVGLFLARISKGRTVREFVIGCVVAPSLVCFAWMTILGATAIDLELSGIANGAISSASNTNKLFITMSYILDGGFLSAMNVVCAVLVLTFLVTTADSGILVMNTIMSGGDQETGIKHRIVWGFVLTGVLGTLLLAAGESNPMEAIQNAMIIGALPFSFILGLMMIAMGKAIYRDHLREKYHAAGLVTAETQL
ncbi:Glycine betaine transporter OpuD [Pseudovibrio sp. Ad13]|uniref:BCCT family transporter n=1 Tax=unclassified Pseudovibrio TaxID=2627060 RepID=UPI00070B9162|nr:MULTISPECIES: BCCT family transporter [unclassified Pseudovibrio]KZK83434.1 Glycine betaine transporter OpuD [Pseudovibrio sp. Ad13]